TCALPISPGAGAVGCAAAWCLWRWCLRRWCFRRCLSCARPLPWACPAGLRACFPEGLPVPGGAPPTCLPAVPPTPSTMPEPSRLAGACSTFVRARPRRGRVVDPGGRVRMRDERDSTERAPLPRSGESFTEAIDEIQGELAALVREAIAARPANEAATAAVEALVGFASREPARARFAMAEALGGGPPAREARDAGIAAIAEEIE